MWVREKMLSIAKIRKARAPAGVCACFLLPCKIRRAPQGSCGGRSSGFRLRLTSNPVLSDAPDMLVRRFLKPCGLWNARWALRALHRARPVAGVRFAHSEHSKHGDVEAAEREFTLLRLQSGLRDWRNDPQNVLVVHPKIRWGAESCKDEEVELKLEEACTLVKTLPGFSVAR